MFHEDWPLAAACWHTSQCPRVKILVKLWTMWCDRVVIKIFSVRCKDNWCQHHSVSRYGDTAAVMEDGSIQYAEFVVEGVLMLVVSCFGVILNIIRYTLRRAGPQHIVCSYKNMLNADVSCVNSCAIIQCKFNFSSEIPKALLKKISKIWVLVFYNYQLRYYLLDVCVCASIK